MVTRYTNTHYIYGQTDLALYTDGRKGVLDEAEGGEQHDIRGGAKESWPSARRWRRGVSVTSRLRKHRRFGVF